ncbi:MAG: hypothetical protein NUV65_00770 [Candidatus Roizmanbacteria bacterium]|nr:hypothetical protein [Candidatus Roizmanbacteria bacterium]
MTNNRLEGSRRDLLRFVPVLGETLNIQDYGPDPRQWSAAAKAS